MRNIFVQSFRHLTVVYIIYIYIFNILIMLKNWMIDLAQNSILYWNFPYNFCDK